MFSSSPRDDDLSIFSQAEREALGRGAVFRQTGWAYGIEQGTRPNTLGFALSSNPLALLAWLVASNSSPFNCRLLTPLTMNFRIGEKFLEWSDENPSLDEILTDVSIYWFTNSISTSFYPYREVRALRLLFSLWKSLRS